MAQLGKRLVALGPGGREAEVIASSISARLGRPDWVVPGGHLPLG